MKIHPLGRGPTAGFQQPTPVALSVLFLPPQQQPEKIIFRRIIWEEMQCDRTSLQSTRGWKARGVRGLNSFTNACNISIMAIGFISITPHCTLTAAQYPQKSHLACTLWNFIFGAMTGPLTSELLRAWNPQNASQFTNPLVNHNKAYFLPSWLPIPFFFPLPLFSFPNSPEEYTIWWWRGLTYGRQNWWKINRKKKRKRNKGTLRSSFFYVLLSIHHSNLTCAKPRWL